LSDTNQDQTNASSQPDTSPQVAPNNPSSTSSEATPAPPSKPMPETSFRTVAKDSHDLTKPMPKTSFGTIRETDSGNSSANKIIQETKSQNSDK
jgi:hypothetical protein